MRTKAFKLLGGLTEVCVLVVAASVIYLGHLDAKLNPVMEVTYQSKTPVKFIAKNDPQRNVVTGREKLTGIVRDRSLLKPVTTIKAGDKAFFYHEWCLYRQKRGEYNSSFWNHIIVKATPRVNIGSVGCWGAFFPIAVPKAVESGKITFKQTMTYYVNFVERSYVIPLPDVTFTYVR